VGNPGRRPKEPHRNDRKGEDMQNLNSKSKEKGQGLVEYILIVGLMGIIAIGAINALSTKTQDGFNKASRKLSSEFSRM
jgi:Flp pilus assembly pilin Flp